MNPAVLRETALVRYGAIPEVAKFRIACTEVTLRRDAAVVVRTHRGVELGTLLQDVDEQFERVSSTQAAEDASQILRTATDQDLDQYITARADCEDQFETWCKRIGEWNLNLELVDLEWMLDRKKLVLYVLNERGPDCTKLALQAAAAGLGIIEVQPVNAEGLVQLESGGGCGTGDCGCH